MPELIKERKLASELVPEQPLEYRSIERRRHIRFRRLDTSPSEVGRQEEKRSIDLEQKHLPSKNAKNQEIWKIQ